VKQFRRTILKGVVAGVPATTLALPMFYKKVDFDVINGFTPIT
jgi:hypothetical protein